VTSTIAIHIKIMQYFLIGKDFDNKNRMGIRQIKGCMKTV